MIGPLGGAIERRSIMRTIDREGVRRRTIDCCEERCFVGDFLPGTKAPTNGSLCLIDVLESRIVLRCRLPLQIMQTIRLIRIVLENVEVLPAFLHSVIVGGLVL